MTNYLVAHSSDESVWKEYVEHPDKLILNCDEYGKSDDKVLDYYSKEFEIKVNDGFIFTCVFPFLGKLIGMAVKKGHKSIKVMTVTSHKTR